MTTDELLAELARRVDHPPTKRAVLNWARAGHIPGPVRVSAVGKRGASFAWPDDALAAAVRLASRERRGLHAAVASQWIAGESDGASARTIVAESLDRLEGTLPARVRERGLSPEAREVLAFLVNARNLLEATPDAALERARADVAAVRALGAALSEVASVLRGRRTIGPRLGLRLDDLSAAIGGLTADFGPLLVLYVATRRGRGKHPAR